MQAKLAFLGAAQNVTGSDYLLETGGRRLLIDCGMYQERDLQGRNWAAFPFDAKSIDAVLLTHAHLDHCGLLPKLHREGFRGPIYCTSATAEIAQVALIDAAGLQQEDAEYKKKRHQRDGYKAPFPEEPLFTVEDARRVFPHFEAVEYGHALTLGGGVEASFHDAGHILGSAMIAIDIGAGGGRQRVIFSGDIGRWDTPILNDPTVFDEADFVVMESTYGDRLHGDCEAIAKQLAEIVNGVREKGGNVVIPTFAIGRAQEVLYYLNQLLGTDRIPSLMVFLDSPMGVNVTEVFERHEDLYDAEMRELIRTHRSPFHFPGLKMCRTPAESKAINHIRGTVIIMAGAGMCTGGRIKHHLVRNLGGPENAVLFVGYQAAGTLGRQIVDGAPEVRIFGQMHPVRARVLPICGFSGHADQAELLRWVRGFRRWPSRIFVTHGEPEAAGIFAGLLRQESTADVAVPRYRDAFDLV